MKKLTGNRRNCVSRLAVLVFVDLMIGTAAFAGGSWTITQLTNDSTDHLMPAISGTNVVWYGWTGSEWGVFSNFAGQVGSTNTTSALLLGYAEGPAISGTNVVWPTHSWDAIYGWDTAISSNFAGQVSQSDNHWASKPDISGTNVVWRGWTANTGYQILSNFAGNLSNNNVSNWYPAISGTNVVWGASGEGGGSAVAVYSNFAGVLATDALEPHPDISGTNVVWMVYEGIPSGGFLQDHIYSNFAGQLSSGSWDTDPAISGTNVVWSANYGAICTNFGGVVWGGNTTPYTNIGPDISGTTVVWQGSDGHNWQIYMGTYTPDVVPAPGGILLVGVGAGLVAWLRRRRSL